MKQKISFTRLTQIWGIILILGVTVSITVVDIIGAWHDFNVRSEEMREEYLARRNHLIKQEVMQVVDMIHHSLDSNMATARKELRSRIDAAYAIAENIYSRNRTSHTDDEIKQMILDALRPVRFDKGLGFYAITRLDGTVILYPTNPEREGSNFLKVRDSELRHMVREILDLARNRGEGFYEYTWTRPGATGDDFKKAAFIKLFRPYGWCIGTSMYLSDIEADIESNLLSVISRIRFGREGYIFINGFNGDALISNGKVIGGAKKLWEVFDDNPKRMKEIFKLEYRAAMKPHGDYISYTHVKLSEPAKTAPKISFIYGIPEMEWLVGAGVYLDDLETEITAMQKRLTMRIMEKVALFSLIALGIAGMFLVILNRLHRRLKNDIDLFISFFKRSVSSSKPIDRDRVQFQELDRIAMHANRMLEARKKTEKALRHSEARLRDLVESSTDLIWEFRIKDNIITYVSPQAETMLGYKPEEMIGRKLTDFISEEEVEKLDAILEDNFKNPRPIRLLENKMSHKNGNKIIVETNAVPFFDQDGNLAGYRGVNRDITKRKMADEELQKAQKLTSIGTLAGGIAHDFNNILMGIFGNIELARLSLTPEHDAYSFLMKACAALDRATKLTRQLLTFARGGDPLLEAVDLREVVRTSVEFNLTGSNIKAIFNLPDDLWQVKADRGQIDQVIANLVINAKQSMPQGGNIYIKAVNIENLHESTIPKLSGKFVKLTIRDQGTGISPRHIDRIFDPYFTTKQAGSGLGLATVHGIIKKHGGLISVESSQEKGTTFTIFLPAETNNPESVQVSKERIQREERNVTGRGSILIMDDEAMVREVAGAMVQKFGYRYAYAADGREALAKYKAAMKNGIPFDVVIMDLTIPGGMGGKEAAAKLLEMDPHAVIIVASGYSTDPVMAHYSKYGFSGRVAKPFDISELQEEIRRVSEEKTPW